ncbi:Low molecular weight protein tyrosine phosphatase (EC 3.1.3.48) [uncultured Gammaproteobacteria bacterium]|jgi:protein-tyrosine phosphatase|nr:Low molecular weight protein tyrosine phosphatase (EC [Bathymodiolus brooksi thiotrophic gill symbiont]CAC9539256.1 Low molecular weight protein tyrosine phosphatase (EC 3.1.3.48) [uncultured Gammaproteobacteria bacterium]CAC9542578.1 Low molecular weight protein tyrosine phosphatase (EC 3.1.3.48) [uncultured Gammaproteobacteria bacterium]CAC9552238.1 Low molecular weight protein tyrosine phosphatase (EC 3.1.3.48) [uncultured Gammaproteobacteria bacterium]CAC9563016.1 Low molecular weight pr
MSNEKIKILFVCMGNICRSPTAEGTFHAQMQKRGVQDLFEIDSAGTHAYHIGEQPDTRSQVAAHKHNVDLSVQRARQVHESDFYYYDYIFAMDVSNLTDLQDICPSEHRHKLSLMLDNIPKNNGKGVPDPYFEGRFDEVFEMLNRASNFLLDRLS